MNDNNPLSISWHDSAFIPLLNPHNVLDYFSERSNPFYDRTCNNEVLKMQRVNPEQLVNMQGKVVFFYKWFTMVTTFSEFQGLNIVSYLPRSRYFMSSGNYSFCNLFSRLSFNVYLGISIF